MKIKESLIYFRWFLSVLITKNLLVTVVCNNEHPNHRENTGSKPLRDAEKGLIGTDSDYKDVLSHFISNEYDKLIRPNYTNGPTVVYVDLLIASFGSIDMNDRSIRIDFYLRQRWNDYRYKHNLSKKIIPLVENMHASQFLWVPDTVLVNSKVSYGDYKPLRSDKVDIQPNGDIFWGTMLSISAHCDLEFKNYPLDVQTCNFGFESYGYTDRHVNYKWKPKEPVKFVSKNIMQFQLVGFSTAEKTIHYVAGNYTVLNLTFRLARIVTVTFINIFFPSYLVVMISWVSFWIHKKSTSARIGTGITTLLSLTAIWSSVNRQVPRVNYVKAIDIHFIVSFAFILMTIVEYAAVAYVNFQLWKMKREYKTAKNIRKSKSKRSSLFNSEPSNVNTDWQRLSLIRGMHHSLSARKYCSSADRRSLRTNQSQIRQNDALNDNLQRNDALNNDLKLRDNSFALSSKNITSSNMVEPSKRNPKNLLKGSRDADAAVTPRVDVDHENGYDSDDSSAEFQDVKVAHVYNTKTSSLDIISRLFFPFAYVCFVIYFWNYYDENLEIQAQ